MKISGTFLLACLLLLSCARPYYTKDKYFNCQKGNFLIDSDLKELIYNSLERAVITEKDIPDFRSFWNKKKIYIEDKYGLYAIEKTIADKELFEKFESDKIQLTNEDVPNLIGDVMFCLKSKEDLQKIANKTGEKFLYLSFDFIIIEGNSAKISIQDNLILPDKIKIGVLSGGGYTSEYKKEGNKWRYVRKISEWIS